MIGTTRPTSGTAVAATNTVYVVDNASGAVTIPLFANYSTGTLKQDVFLVALGINSNNDIISLASAYATPNP